jgi:hypothetical protein
MLSSKTTSELYNAFYDAPGGHINWNLFYYLGPSVKMASIHFAVVAIKKCSRPSGYVGDDGQHRLNI